MTTCLTTAPGLVCDGDVASTNPSAETSERLQGSDELVLGSQGPDVAALHDSWRDLDTSRTTSTGAITLAGNP